MTTSAISSRATVVPHWYTYPPKNTYRDVTSNDDLIDLTRVKAGGKASLYVHIPFCNMKCSFCSLYTSAGYSERAVNEYTDALTTEIASFVRRQGDTNLVIQTLYFGGGTPALFPRDNLSKILSSLSAVGDLRASRGNTVEFSPDTTDAQTVKAWREADFDRASIGVQTFDDQLLRVFRRRHSAQDAREAIRRLQGAGYREINVDLIFGHEAQTERMWMRDVAEVLGSGATSCTFHPLSSASKTEFERKSITSKQSPNKTLSMHSYALSAFQAAGWRRTSAISVSISGSPNPIEHAEAQGITTIGFGAGSRSYFPGAHLSTVPYQHKMAFGQVLSRYFDAVRSGKIPALSIAHVSAEEQARRLLILQLHHGSIARVALDRVNHPGLRGQLVQSIERFTRAGWLEERPEQFVLTDAGAVQVAQLGEALASAEVQSALNTNGLASA